MTAARSALARQRNCPERLSGKAFVLAVSAIALRTAAAQIVLGVVISLTGLSWLDWVLYAYLLLQLLDLLRQTVSVSEYVLTRDSLRLRRMLGDYVTASVVIPLDQVQAIRPVAAGERLKLGVGSVRVMDRAAQSPLRVRAAIWLSLVSARLARLAAGGREGEIIGHAVVYRQGRRSCACIIRPDEQMLCAMACACDACGKDERTAAAGVFARALQRAFPALYPHVLPLTDAAELAQANEEIEHRRERAKARKAKARKAKAAQAHKAEKGKKRGKQDKKQSATQTAPQEPRRRRMKDGQE